MISLNESSIWLCKWGDTCYPYSIYWLIPVFVSILLIGIAIGLYLSKLDFGFKRK